MKRFLLFSLCLIFCIGLQAQRSNISNDKYQPSLDKHIRQVEQTAFQPNLSAPWRLWARISDDYYEFKFFSYNWQGLVVAIKDSVGTFQVIDSIYYNNNSQVTKINCYQKLNGVWKYVCYVNFYYDDAGNLIKRTNFNSLGTETFEQGGVYDYHYENGHIVDHVMYFGDYSTLGERCYYTYNDQGRLITEKYLQGYGYLDSAMNVNYTYRSDGKLTRKTVYDFYDNTTQTEVYEYDGYGNCIEHSIKNQSGNYVDRNYYEYDTDVPASVVSMPYYIEELSIPEPFDDAHQRTVEHWYTLNDNNVLQYICDYYYYYEESPLGIAEVSAESAVHIYPNPATDVVNIDIPEGKTVLSAQIIDIYGKVCGDYILQSGTNAISTSNLMSGMYLLKIIYADGERAVGKMVRR